MKNATFMSKASAIAVSILLTACGGGGAGGGGGGSLYIESCSLGCSGGSGGSQVACSIDQVGINPEFVVLFSGPVDLQSVDNQSLRFQNATNGSIPAFEYALDPLNPRRLIARPILSTDPAGNPVFSLEANQTYIINVPGTAQGDTGPFVRAVGGGSNESRLSCLVQTTTEVLDAVPGAPKAQVFVDTLSGNDVLVSSGSSPIQDVRLSSQVTIVFDDLMNIATLASPQTGNAPFARVLVDPDGNTNDVADQVLVGGSWTAFWDQELYQTTFVFTAEGGFPSSGSALTPRKIVIDLPEQISDLKGNGLDNSGAFIFVPESQPFENVILPADGGEGFADNANHAEAFSGAEWGESGVDENGAGFDYLGFGLGGGSGRLGELVINPGEVVTLNTDSTEFPLQNQVRDLLDNAIPGRAGFDPSDANTWPTITVTDGRFEFSRLEIKGNGRLVIEGSQAGRVYSRGELVLDGILDCSGESPEAHPSNSFKDEADISPETAFGGSGGAGGPAAGAGGKGGDRYDHTDSAASLRFQGGIPNPGAVIDGGSGEGVGGVADAGYGQGTGGEHWPPVIPDTNQHNPTGGPPNTIGDIDYSVVFNGPLGANECRVATVGQPGAGGGYALAGTSGIPNANGYFAVNPGNITNTPSPTPPGDLFGVALEAPGPPAVPPSEAEPYNPVRNLAGPNLRGGSGGGGAGMHLWGVRTNGIPADDQDSGAACFAASGGFIFPYWDHSGAGGGGGGGAIQVTSGGALQLNGQINCSGGVGGGATVLNQNIWACTSDGAGDTANKIACAAFASPGGGGSGGAIKIQARTIALQNVSNRLIVSGGEGGEGVGGSLGGAGGPGLVRYEIENGPDFMDLAGQTALASTVAPWVSPFDAADPTFNDPFESAAILSVGRFEGEARERPDSMNGAMSCWMKPNGNFFQLTFNADDDADTSGTFEPSEMGWNMDVVYQIGVDVNGDPLLDLMPYRGVPNATDEPNFPLSGESFEDFLGQSINHGLPFGSLFTVRFQGARLDGTLNDPCDVTLGGVQSDIADGSLTPWVRHPEELGLFSPSPNMIRFCVIMEESMKDNDHPQSLVNQQILGVTNLQVAVTPD